MTLQQQIVSVVKNVLVDMELADLEPSVSASADPTHGDYATNVAMIAAKKLGKNPREVAEEIAEKLKHKMFEKIEVAGPGFINFFVTNDYLIDQLGVESKEKKLSGKKIVVEYTDPNPFKEFHIGHLYSNIVGESIARILEASGAIVWRADYFGDVGMHVANSIWGLLKKFAEDKLSIDDLASRELKERISYFGQAYALGATAYKEDPQAKEEIKELNFLIFKAAQEVVLPEFKEKAQIDYDKFIKKGAFDYEEIKHLYAIGREWSLAYFEEIYKRLGTKFDGYYPESRTGEYGYGMVMEGLKKGIFEKGEGGAIIFPGSKYGLHERVFINSLGLPTYETKDFGNAVAKEVDFSYDQSVVITGNEINEYFQVIIKSLSLLRPKLGGKTIHIGHGMVRLPEGKMSSRTGKILRGEWLLDEAKKYASKLSDSKEIAEMVGIAAIKYALLKNSIGKNVEFNFEESISFEGNSGPYLQYTFVRTQSVIARSGGLPSANWRVAMANTIHPEERNLLRLLVRFEDVVTEAATRYAPNVLCTYLFELAQAFNLFYQKHQILKEKEPIKEFRLSLTKATGDVLKQGLSLLGIQAPDKM